MINRYAQPGVVEGIWLREERLADPVHVAEATLGPAGLEGDHGRAGKRAVTLIQAEHLAVIGAMLGKVTVDAAALRRNLVVSGLNLNGLKGRQLRIGAALVEVTTICAPCSRMEAALGPGGYAAMRGHGGWCATVLEPGSFKIGDLVVPQAVLA
ncbi:MOSC domain-containing protein [Sulfitobacter sp. JB4-11]|uniref:MOSC domain-containing protein n=1 Tax=Sulfitobacter rhodophyticola TaxID=3238304 RepID=UPI0035131B76